MATQPQVRERAAQRLQAVFRGWRTRSRVVWEVRSELDAFMEVLEADVEMERLLLALPKPQVHSWQHNVDVPRGSDTASSPRWLLQLPRIEDDVFGWKSSFPEPAQPLGDVAHCEITMNLSASLEESAVNDGVEATVPPVSPLEASQDADAEDSFVSNDSAVEDGVETAVSPISTVASSREVDAEWSEDGWIADEHSPARLLRPEDTANDEQQKNEEDGNLTGPGPSQASSGNAEPVAAADCAFGMHSEEKDSEEVDTTISPSIERPPIAGSLDECRTTTSDRPLTVDHILATHSKCEIAQELEWAKQALQNRVHYLQTRHKGGGRNGVSF